jgi:hypothetical protein
MNLLVTRGHLGRASFGNFKDIAEIKAGDITAYGLKEIMDEFPEALDTVKPLCLKIRKILFPLDKMKGCGLGPCRRPRPTL